MAKTTLQTQGQSGSTNCILGGFFFFS